MKRILSFRWLFCLVGILPLLAACGGSGIPDAVLPLADDGPTFLFFYTDN